jgi:hypothetical protein
MSESNESPPGFAEVFRHELGAVMDRRRSQRIESFERVGADGDYSRTTVRWAIAAANEEIRLANKAVQAARQAYQLAQRVQETDLAVGQARSASPGKAEPHLRKVGEHAKQAAAELRQGAARQMESAPGLDETPLATSGAPEPGEPLPIETAPREEKASDVRLRDYALAAAEVLDRVAADDAPSLSRAVTIARKTAETTRDFLWRARVIRKCESAAPLRGTIEEIGQKAAASEAAQSKAIAARKAAQAKARQIIAAAEANRAAEAADSAWEVARLMVGVVTPTDRAAVAVETLTAALVTTRVAARAARAAVQLPSTNDTSSREGIRAVAAVVEALRAAARELDQNPATAPVPPEVQALYRRLREGTLATATEAAAAITAGCARALRTSGSTLPPDVLTEAAGVVTALREIVVGTTSFKIAGGQGTDENSPLPPPWPDLCEAAEALTRATCLSNEAPQVQGRDELVGAVTALNGLVETILETRTFPIPQVQAPPPPAVTSPLEGPFEAARNACEQLARQAFGALAPQEAQGLAQAWQAKLARDIATRAVKELGKQVIAVAQWAWTAEVEATDAFRSAHKFLDDLQAPGAAVSPANNGRAVPPGGPGEPSRQLITAPREPPPAGPDLEQPRLQALDLDLVGLAFSGGGIRSATFGLGVLQALAELRLLRIFDYFSTVSGGGYIGGWLAAWIHREGSLSNVEKQLSPSRVEQSRAQRNIKQNEGDPLSSVLPLWPAPVDEEPEPVHHLRAYSRYLIPRPGVFSADIWTLGSIYVRNLVINLAILVPFVLALVLLSRLLLWAFTWNRELFDGWARHGVAGAFVFSAAVIVVWLYHQRTRLQEAAADPTAHPDGADRVTAGLGAASLCSVSVLGIAALFRFVGARAGWIGLGLVGVVLVGECLSPLVAALFQRLCTTRPARAIQRAIVAVVWYCGVPLRGAVPMSQTPATGLARALRWVGGGMAWFNGVLLREARRVLPGGGVALVLCVLLLVVASLWLFSYSPPASDTTVRLTGTDAQTLPLRHPGYHWLNHESPIKGWTNVGKFLIAYAVGMAVLSLLATVRRLSGLIRSTLAHWVNPTGRRPGRASIAQIIWGIWVLFWCDVVLGGGLGTLLFLALYLVVWPLGTDSAAILTLGPPAILGTLILADYGEMLLVGRWMNESEREWRSRLGAVLFMIALGWLIFFGITLYLPWAVQQVAVSPTVQATLIATAAAVWSVLSGLGAWAGRWLQAGNVSRRSIPWLRLLAGLGPPVFLVGLLAGVSLLAFVLPPRGQSSCLDLACDPSVGAALKWGGYFLLSTALILLFGLTVDVNLFSLHMLYANRLIRCYLGASRRKQNWSNSARGPFLDSSANRFWGWETGASGAPTGADTAAVARRERTFTDLDPADDIPLRHLKAVEPEMPRRETDSSADTPACPSKGYRGPYPLLNTALNLVAENELAVQDRKADSFVLTPDYCGSEATGFAWIPGDSKASPNLTLGRAMTISGAAVDPNMGLYQSPPLTALMTILNTRLGWWIENPARYNGRWTGAGPGAGSLLLWELFGQTDKTSDYVHLSDGGHFENLGVYELVRRRCRFIVVTDVGEDRYAASENLANLVRLVRTDFGIRIDLDTNQLTEQSGGLSRWHCAIGLIHYEDVDARAVAGVLVYLRASLTGDEPADIRQYANACPAFPRQTTLDQFFNEAQLESYRALGYHVAGQVFGDAAVLMNRDACDPVTIQSEVRALFANVRRRWFPSPPQAEQNFMQATQLFLNVEGHLRDPSFRRLRQELYPEVPDGPPQPGPVAPPPGAASDAGTEMHQVSEMLQTMEMVWFAMKLDSYHAHPLNRGWMNLFRRWTGSRTFQRYWPFLRAEYSQDFVRFCERALNMVPISAVRQRVANSAALARWLGVIRDMDAEFHQEWASEKDRLGWLTTGHYIREAVAASTAFAQQLSTSLPLLSSTGTIPTGVRPLVWMLSLPDIQGTSSTGENCSAMLSQRPCGLVCAFPPSRGSGLDLEFLVWLRGPYRNIGVGRFCLRSILNDLADELRRTTRTYRLLVYYPDGGANRADRLQKALWMNFFFDHQFRSVLPADPGAVPGVITLARDIGA